ncbi:MAG: ABC transporter substrate-binding protein [Deltaproteobacteria bacterium]|nr:ABC transporter substrate-binding protein [Deltaproteobacteria bacterium]
MGGVPTDQIKSTVDKALVVLKDPRLKPAAKTKERREQLKQILFARFDFAEMAKRSLGANWRRRTPKEQKRSSCACLPTCWSAPTPIPSNPTAMKKSFTSENGSTAATPTSAVKFSPAKARSFRSTTGPTSSAANGGSTTSWWKTSAW